MPGCVHSTANNPRSPQFRRNYYKAKLDWFMEECDLINYLAKKMKRDYTPPQARPIDFDHKMKRFLGYKRNKMDVR